MGAARRGALMQEEVVRWLNELNARFYRNVHRSFSETRSSAWPGWERLLALPLFDREKSGEPLPLRVLDVACGNMRFERFLESSVDCRLELYAMDNCMQLVPERNLVSFAEVDVVDALLGLNDDSSIVEHAHFGVADAFDLVVSFGFLHHIPDFEMRIRFLSSLVLSVRDGGFVAVSLWRFMDSEKLASKASLTHRRACDHFSRQTADPVARFACESLEANDYFLGWGDEDDTFRYCHHFADEEVTKLVEALSGRAELVDDFCADGKTGALNRYLVFRRL